MDVDFDVFNISDFEPDLDELEKYLFNDDIDEKSTLKRKRSDDGSDEVLISTFGLTCGLDLCLPCLFSLFHLTNPFTFCK